LQPGDELLAFSENPDPETKLRRWELSTVEANEPFEADTLRIELSDGTALEATLDHPFLTRLPGHHNYEWITAAELQRRFLKSKRTSVCQQTSLLRYLTPWEEGNT